LAGWVDLSFDDDPVVPRSLVGVSVQDALEVVEVEFKGVFEGFVRPSEGP
jgi:hypothetical protein